MSVTSCRAAACPCSPAHRPTVLYMSKQERLLSRQTGADPVASCAHAHMLVLSFLCRLQAEGALREADVPPPRRLRPQG